MLSEKEAALMMKVGMHWTVLLMLARDITMRDLENLTKASSTMRALADQDPGRFTDGDLAMIRQLPIGIYLLQTIKHHEVNLEEGWQPQPLVGGLGGFPR